VTEIILTIARVLPWVYPHGVCMADSELWDACYSPVRSANRRSRHLALFSAQLGYIGCF
jgi:hypothetical protein